MGSQAAAVGCKPISRRQPRFFPIFSLVSNI
jgi:hypothetical protein